MQKENQYGLVRFSAGSLNDAILSELDRWQKENKTKALWQHDAKLWTNHEENQWLGWLDIDVEKKEIPRIEALAQEIKSAGFTDIVLLGIGGSSLCPAMMAETFGKIADYPRLHILDSTDPQQIRHLEKKLNLQTTFFIVSSKSGNTLEPNIFKDYFYTRLQKILETNEVGNRFIAITDKETSLAAHAKENHFKTIFYGVTSIGGRYSALSNFGMVPSGLMGVDVKEFLHHVKTMQQACSPDVVAKDNPGVVLGIILGVCAKNGKDKVTLIASPGIHSLGAWLEQLLAESTGKSGKGLIPIDQEILGSPSVYSDDRVFVYIRLDDEPDPKQDAAIDILEQAGFVIVRLHVADKMHLGAELFRWEIATAVVGSVLDIDPFNQPDVEESKVLTLKMTAEYDHNGQLSQPTSFFSANGLQLFTDERNKQEISQLLQDHSSLLEYLKAHLNRLKKGDYLDISAFIEMSKPHLDLLQQTRLLIRDHKKVATCLGFGPRFLHSTGQDYKGGPNTGVFIQLTADYDSEIDIRVPNHKYTFGVVIAAQAQADFDVLAKRKRRALRVHLGKDVQQNLQQLHQLIKLACTS